MASKSITMKELEDMWKPAYFYFDTPDYEDPGKKLYFAGKWSLILGSGYAFMKAFTFTPNTVTALVNGIGRYPPYLLAAALSYSGVQIATAMYRKKDDSWNYAAGGVAYALLHGLFYRKQSNAIIMGIVTGFLGAGLKSMHVDGKMMGNMPNVRQRMIKSDFSFNILSSVKDPGRRTF